MNQELARSCFCKALAYVSANAPEELEWVRSLSPQVFEGMSCSEFLEEYCWVVYASGFRVSILKHKFDQLKAAYCKFDIDQICKTQPVDAALAVINNRRKAEGFIEGCRRIQVEGFETFKARVKEGTINVLRGLPFIGCITMKHLARNIGLHDVSKDDVHLVRMAKEFEAASVEELTSFLAREFEEKEGVIDLILWRYCADGVWESKLKESASSCAY